MFSVVTINYNNSIGLQRTILSVLNQSFKDFEYIVVDGKSTDNSLQILAKTVDSKLHYKSEADSGIYDAFNKGVKLCSHEYILFVNSGDILSDKNVLKNLHNEIERDPTFSGYYGKKRYAKFSATNEVVSYSRIWNPGIHKKWKYLYGWMIPHQALLVRRSLFDKYGDFDLRFNIASDYDWLLRVFFVNHEKARFCEYNIITMEDGGVSNSSYINIIKSNMEVLRGWRKYYWVFPFWIFVTKPLTKALQVVRAKLISDV